VNGAVFSPDGTKLASVSWDTTIKIWDAASGICLTTLSGHDGAVNAIAFSPDGTKLASVSWDTTIKIWDAASGICLTTLSGHDGAVNAIAFSPDGTKLVSGSWDRTVKVWDLAGRRCLATLTGHEGGVNAVAFSPDGQTAASASADHTIKLWDLNRRRCLTTLTGHSEWVNGVAFSPDGKKLVSGSGDQTVKVWDLAARRCLATLTGHEGGVNAVAFYQDGRMVTSASSDRTVKVWDTASEVCLITLSGHRHRVHAVAFSPDGTKLVSGSYDETLKVWDLSLLFEQNKGEKPAGLMPFWQAGTGTPADWVKAETAGFILTAVKKTAAFNIFPEHQQHLTEFKKSTAKEELKKEIERAGRESNILSAAAETISELLNRAGRIRQDILNQVLKDCITAFEQLHDRVLSVRQMTGLSLRPMEPLEWRPAAEKDRKILSRLAEQMLEAFYKMLNGGAAVLDALQSAVEIHELHNSTQWNLYSPEQQIRRTAQIRQSEMVPETAIKGIAKLLADTPSSNVVKEEWKKYEKDPLDVELLLTQAGTIHAKKDRTHRVEEQVLQSILNSIQQ
jgi:dipeptidyl aminopeptidase/acylaminoacyl peptidase